MNANRRPATDAHLRLIPPQSRRETAFFTAFPADGPQRHKRRSAASSAGPTQTGARTPRSFNHAARRADRDCPRRQRDQRPRERLRGAPPLRLPPPAPALPPVRLPPLFERLPPGAPFGVRPPPLPPRFGLAPAPARLPEGARLPSTSPRPGRPRPSPRLGCPLPKPPPTPEF